MAEKLKDWPSAEETVNDSWPISSEEIERFVALIYEDRRRSAEASLAEPPLFE
jgi:hypothetical protein